MAGGGVGVAAEFLLLQRLRPLFEDKLTSDDRSPAFTFRVPTILERIIILWGEDDANEATTPATTMEFGFYLPRLHYWTQAAALLLLQSVLQCLFAVVVYRCIVVPKRKKQNRQQQQQKQQQHRDDGKATTTTASSSTTPTPTSAYLVGCGVVILLALYLPFVLLEGLDVQNRGLKFSLNTLPTVVVFRTIEALSGTPPTDPAVEVSLGNYVAYYSSLAHYVWNPRTQKRQKISWRKLLQMFLRILLHYQIVSLVLSFELPYDFQPFSSPVRLDAFHFHNPRDLLTWSHLANCYLLGLLTFYMLSLGFELSAFAENLVKGYDTLPVFCNPLFESRCPSEFWGQKWNLVVHRTLKHAVYLPARSSSAMGWSRSTAVLVTFLASGLLHDYSWSVIFYENQHQRDEHGNCLDDNNNCWTPFPLKLTAFFLWNGAVILLEQSSGPLAEKYFAWFTRHLPTVVVSTLVLLTALPVSHWFTGDWAVGGNYADFALAVWQVRRIS